MEQKSAINWRLGCNLSGCQFVRYCLNAVGNFVVHALNCNCVWLRLRRITWTNKEAIEYKMHISTLCVHNNKRKCSKSTKLQYQRNLFKISLLCYLRRKEQHQWKKNCQIVTPNRKIPLIYFFLAESFNAMVKVRATRNYSASTLYTAQ